MAREHDGSESLPVCQIEREFKILTQLMDNSIPPTKSRPSPDDPLAKSVSLNSSSLKWIYTSPMGSDPPRLAPYLPAGCQLTRVKRLTLGTRWPPSLPVGCQFTRAVWQFRCWLCWGSHFLAQPAGRSPIFRLGAEIGFGATWDILYEGKARLKGLIPFLVVLASSVLC